MNNGFFIYYNQTSNDWDLDTETYFNILIKAAMFWECSASKSKQFEVKLYLIR